MVQSCFFEIDVSRNDADICVVLKDSFRTSSWISFDADAVRYLSVYVTINILLEYLL